VFDKTTTHVFEKFAFQALKHSTCHLTEV